jgi:hypothetical protein
LAEGSTTLKASDFQPLLLNRNYVVIPKLKTEVAEYLECSVEKLTGSMSVFRQRHDSYTASIDLRLFPTTTSPSSSVGVNQLSGLDEKRLSTFYQVDGKKGYYSSAVWAKQAVFLHVLLNVCQNSKDPWASKYLRSNKPCSMLLLVPVTECNSLTFACAFLYTVHDGNNVSIMCSLIEQDGVACEPFCCGTIS